MPLWLRRTTWNLMQEYYKKQEEERENQQNALKNNKGKKIDKPNINTTPDYTTKAPRK
jgi:hypothetical protein